MSVSYGGSNITFEDGSIVSSGSQGFKNKIINGAMMIDQRNAGASVSLTAAAYTLDRWQCYVTQTGKATTQQNQGSITPPPGFTNYLGYTSSSAYSVVSTDIFTIRQIIEGYNVADLDWGKSTAKTVTLSCWVRSSLNGTFAGGLTNQAQTRSYGFNYTINSSNTWEYKTITIAGDTTGTWATDTTRGIDMFFSLGMGSTYTAPSNGSWLAGAYYSGPGGTSLVGTSGATFQITGVQLEKGTTASSFEFRSIQKELILCQRYYEKSFDMATKPAQNVGTTAGTLITGNYSGTAFHIVASTTFAVRKRVSPTTLTTYNPYAAGSGWSSSGSGNFTASNYAVGEQSIGLRVDGATGSTGSNMSIHWSVEAEL
jgi:hypothetical protein